jgi:penicillin-binding protein 1A
LREPKNPDLDLGPDDAPDLADRLDALADQLEDPAPAAVTDAAAPNQPFAEPDVISAPAGASGGSPAGGSRPGRLARTAPRASKDAGPPDDPEPELSLDAAAGVSDSFDARPEAAGSPKKSKPPRIRGPKRPRSLLFRLCLSAFWGGLGLLLAGSVVVLLAYAYFSQNLPDVEGLKTYLPKTVTYFYSRDGRIIGEYSHERRIVVPLAEIPALVREAFLATEDARFYHHRGVNPKAIVRAAYKTVFDDQIQGASTITQQVVRGLLLTSERKIERKIREIILAMRLESIMGKDEILEIYLNQIYLGQGAYGVEAAARTYFDKGAGQLTVAEAAMLAGFTQSPEGKNPIRRPDEARRRQLHVLNRMVVEGFLTPEGAQAAAAEILNVVGERPNPNTTVAPWFSEHVRRILAERLGEESLYNDGWRVYTTLDLEAQKAADESVARGLWEYARRRGFKGPVARLEGEADIERFRQAVENSLPMGAMLPDRLYQAVVLEIVGKDELKVAVGAFEGTITKKNLEWILPKGALAKQLARGDVVWVRLEPQEAAPDPLAASETSREAALQSIARGAAGDGGHRFVLEQRTDVQAALLSMDLSDGGVRAMVGGRDFSESQFNRATQSQRQPGSSFKPVVYTAAMDNGFTPGSIMVDGPVVIDDPGTGRRWKPLNSDQKFLGPMTLYSALVASRNLVSVKVLERVGFEALDKTAADLGITAKLPHSPPVALGAHGITMPEMITAYSAFPNLGRRVDPRYITRIEDRFGRVVATFEPVFHQAISPGTACVLTSMLRGVVAQGTGTSVKPLNRPVGGKTGTTNDHSDAWFVGFTPEYVTAVWMGTDQLKPRAVGEVGGRAAGPIFLYYMSQVLKDVPIVDFTVPPDAVMTPGGAFGICYKAGTVGTGISETTTASLPEEDFLRHDMFEEDPVDLAPVEDQSAAL